MNSFTFEKKDFYEIRDTPVPCLVCKEICSCKSCKDEFLYSDIQKLKQGIKDSQKKDPLLESQVSSTLVSITVPPENPPSPKLMETEL